jgi:hypothetical protein
MITGTFDVTRLDRIWRSTSMPSIRGIMMSSRIRSGSLAVPAGDDLETFLFEPKLEEPHDVGFVVNYKDPLHIPSPLPMVGPTHAIMRGRKYQSSIRAVTRQPGPLAPGGNAIWYLPEGRIW